MSNRLESFGFQVQFFDTSFDDLVRVFRDAERAGFTSGWGDDHFYNHFMGPRESGLEAWITLAGLARETSKLRLGILVTCNNFRHPALLAREAATVDILSDGRLEFGIGAGWQIPEHEQLGFRFPSASDRSQMLREATEIIRKLWTGEPVSYEGEFYKLKDGICNAVPVQKPNPPITIGGGGEKKTLRTAAQLADWSNFGFSDIETFARRVAKAKEYCKAVNRNPDSLKFSTAPVMVVGKTKEDTRSVLKNLKGRYKPVPQVGFEQAVKELENVGHIIGDPDECAEKLKRYMDAGASYFMLRHEDFATRKAGETFDFLAEKVITKI
jgi:F420-dependent oxidoreductase-like protein